ncbi:DUF1014-domain-containing protein [Neoconidiobolus thromboides FSU 785]|nr:DUF1014-domain-containing protein [Neoconidiobolus thromboides FSU 785]
MARFKGENSKVTAAKEKKAAVKEEKAQKEKAVKDAAEDEYWSKGAKKGGKAEDKEAKKAREAAKKAELELLKKQEEEEISKIKVKKNNKSAGDKKPVKKDGSSSGMDGFLNQLNGKAEYQARNIDDAIDLLDTMNEGEQAINIKSGGIELHPERRAKAAYTQFEAKRLPILKEENKGLRLTQLKQLLWKEWQKSPENPFNQAHLGYNASRQDKVDLVDQTRKDIESRLKI